MTFWAQATGEDAGQDSVQDSGADGEQDSGGLGGLVRDLLDRN